MIKSLKSYLPLTIILFTFAFFAGCKKNDNVVNPNSNTNNNVTAPDVSSTTDAAYAVAANLAIDNGGAFEDMSDLLLSASTDGLKNEDSNGMPDFDNCHSGVAKSYDSTTGWWTVTVTRHRGNVNGKYYTNYERVYKYQFLDTAGMFQKYYITKKDTAVNANYEIVSADGILRTPKVSDRLVSLTAAWNAGGINSKQILLNTTSPYVRAVSDTMTRNNSKRTLNGTLSVNFIKITSPSSGSPKGGTLNWQGDISGTIDGTYHAVVTFQKGTVYSDSTIDKTIHIVFGPQIRVSETPLKADLTVNNTKYQIDLQTGEVTQ